MKSAFVTKYQNLATPILLCLTALLVGCRSVASGTATGVTKNLPPAPELANPTVASLQRSAITLASYQEKAPEDTTETTNDAKSKSKGGPEDENLLPQPLTLEPVVVETLESPTGGVVSLTLPEAINIALRQNPNLTAVRASEPVARGALAVAQTYPYNPQYQAQVLPYSRFSDGSNGAVNSQHVLVQTFELGGQQRYREGVAAGLLRQVQGTISQAELTNVALTSRLYFTAVYQRELRDLNRTLTDLNESQIGVIERREKAGQANSADVALAKLQAQASRRQQRLSEANYRTALLALRTQLNVDRNVPLELSMQWTKTTWGELDEQYLQQIVSSRPDVVAARAAVVAARANLNLANAMRRPNLQTGPLFQRDESATVFWGIQAQINVPVVNTGKPLVQQNAAALRQQQITVEQLENRARLEVQAAIGRYTRARQLLEDSRGDFERDLTEALRPFEDQFKAGQITLLQVFAARTTLTQAQQSYLDLLNEVSQAAVDVTQATGVPPQQFFLLESSSQK